VAVLEPEVAVLETEVAVLELKWRCWGMSKSGNFAFRVGLAEFQNGGFCPIFGLTSQEVNKTCVLKIRDMIMKKICNMICPFGNKCRANELN
jgi:hypothetical protein